MGHYFLDSRQLGIYQLNELTLYCQSLNDKLDPDPHFTTGVDTDPIFSGGSDPDLTQFYLDPFSDETDNGKQEPKLLVRQS